MLHGRERRRNYNTRGGVAAQLSGCGLTWFMMVIKMCSVLTTVMFLSWAWFGAPDTCTISALPDIVNSSHRMLKSLMAFLMFLATIVASGPLLPDVDSSLGEGGGRGKGEGREGGRERGRERRGGRERGRKGEGEGGKGEGGVEQ